MPEPRAITNDDDVFDSRDVIERIKFLEETAGLAFEEETELPAADNDFDPADWLTDCEADELRALRALADEGAEVSDWKYGETLIRDSYFVQYAQELAHDIGAIPSDNSWPARCIDWERAARDLRMDYISLDFDGVTYWARA